MKKRINMVAKWHGILQMEKREEEKEEEKEEGLSRQKKRKDGYLGHEFL